MSKLSRARKRRHSPNREARFKRMRAKRQKTHLIKKMKSRGRARGGITTNRHRVRMTFLHPV